ncbi:MAG: hypothetical protein ACLUNO_03155 [Oscillospiraceae bacterium]
MIRQVKNRDGRLRFHRALRYGTCVCSIRRDSQRRANIWFSTIFGGGTNYAHGEDTLFLCDAFRRGLRVYTSSFCLGTCAAGTRPPVFTALMKSIFTIRAFCIGETGAAAVPLCLRFCLKRYGAYREEMTFSKLCGQCAGVPGKRQEKETHNVSDVLVRSIQMQRGNRLKQENQPVKKASGGGVKPLEADRDHSVIAVIALAVLVVVLVRGHKPADTLSHRCRAQSRIPVSAERKAVHSGRRPCAAAGVGSGRLPDRGCLCGWAVCRARICAGWNG